MINQKPNEGSARDTGREGAGDSMGRDMGASNTGNGGHGGHGGNSGNLAGEPNKDVSVGAASPQRTVDKAAETARPMVDRLATTAHTSVDKVSGALAGASQAVDNKARQLTDAYQHFADTGRDYVRTRPATSVLVALAAGYVLSMLSARRR